MNTGAAISSIITFPNIAWWAAIAGFNTIYFDGEAHYEKMSYQNRYYIAGANGLTRLTIPLLYGRRQRTAMKEALTDPKEQWQIKHWRTIASAYKRSPYFDFYEQSLQALFEQPYTRLADFNMASVNWLKQQLGTAFEGKQTDTFKKKYENIRDLRNVKPTLEKNGGSSFPTYYQVFGERNGFLPNLSLLDLLFCEGPHARQWLSDNATGILAAI